ncbi:MAG: hypothetical protein RIQ79_2329 [Verrucomicrobiota bacterium]
MRLLLIFFLFVAGGMVCRGESEADKVLFEFYSSAEQEVSLAYLNDLKDAWRFVKMEKEGNRFFVRHPVGKEIWYEFVVSPNVWFRRDPFNRFVNENHPYLKRGPALLTTNRNLKVTYVPSAHFDYFTTGDGKKIKVMEELYTKLTTDILTIFEPDLKPVHGKKIRYYGGMFEGVYATAGNAELIVNNDASNCHEIIHVLLHDYPHYGPFAEGVAQCLQQAGNQRPLTEANCSLAAKDKRKQVKLWDVLSDFGNHKDYHLAGSFIYYNLFAAPQARAPFVAFLKDLREGSITFEEVQARYQKHTGKELSASVRDWERWIATVGTSSNVYVDWRNGAK